MDNKTKTAPQTLMKIGQLAAVSGVNRSTIHHYLNLGLLPEPVTAGLNIHLYSRIHLAMLNEIRKLREKKKLPLTEIKEQLDQRDWSELPDEPLDMTTESSKAREHSVAPRRDSGVKKEQIIETATDLFSRVGYEAVRISDITDALWMSKATFYEYFQGKEQLFMECIERLVVHIVPREGWRSIDAEKDFFKRQRLRAREFLKSFPGYSGVLHQARIFSRVDNPELAAKAKKTFHILTRPTKRDIENAQAEGMIRPFDPEIGAHILLGVAEGIGWKSIVDPGIDIEQVLEEAFDLLMFGLSPKRTSDGKTRSGITLSAELLDIQGIETSMTALRFDGQDYLEGKIGEALVKVDLRNTIYLRVDQVESDRIEMSVTAGNNQELSVHVKRDIEITGLTPFGEITIPLEKAVKITITHIQTDPDR